MRNDVFLDVRNRKIITQARAGGRDKLYDRINSNQRGRPIEGVKKVTLNSLNAIRNLGTIFYTVTPGKNPYPGAITDKPPNEMAPDKAIRTENSNQTRHPRIQMSRLTAPFASDYSRRLSMSFRNKSDARGMHWAALVWPTSETRFRRIACPVPGTTLWIMPFEMVSRCQDQSS